MPDSEKHLNAPSLFKRLNFSIDGNMDSCPLKLPRILVLGDIARTHVLLATYWEN